MQTAHGWGKLIRWFEAYGPGTSMMMYLRTPSCMPCDKNDGESRVLEICTHGSTRAAGLTPAATLLVKDYTGILYNDI